MILEEFKLEKPFFHTLIKKKNSMIKVSKYYHYSSLMKVAKYREYDEDGNQLLGIYGRIFEEEYKKALNARGLLLDTPYDRYLQSIETSKTHSGYFSIDKKGRSVDSPTKRNSDESDDISAYDLILKNKERLLSFEEPTRFIFSHSALREGWDNPNVFQICTLKYSANDVQRHQEVGRGLKNLCE